ncbi:MAG: DUF2490 domain-containing protein [Flavobacteriales bacterium]
MFPTVDASIDLNSCFSANVYLFNAIKPYANTISGTEDKARSLYTYGESGLSYKINSVVSFTAAYVYERQEPFTTNYRNEHRVFPQITLRNNFKRIELKQRLRYDLRFIQDRINDNWPFYHRLRYLAGARWTIKNSSNYIFAYSEYFISSKKNDGLQFIENWSALQFGKKINDHHSLEIGPLFVGWKRNSAGDWLRQYYVQFTWVARPISKKS